MNKATRPKEIAKILNGSLEFLSELDKIIAENTRRPDIEDIVFSEYQFPVDFYDYEGNWGEDWDENNPEIIMDVERFIETCCIEDVMERLERFEKFCWNCYNNEAGPKEQLEMCDGCWDTTPPHPPTLDNEGIWQSHYMRDWGDDRTVINPYHPHIVDIVTVDGIKYIANCYRNSMAAFKPMS